MTRLDVLKYRTDSRHLLAQARSELDAGDLRQASEKGWGAAAQIVKAVAQARGWQHRHHARLTEAAETLAAETGDDDIADGFAIANALHVNFYEDAMRPRTVRRHLSQIEGLMDKLEPLAGQYNLQT